VTSAERPKAVFAVNDRGPSGHLEANEKSFGGHVHSGRADSSMRWRRRPPMARFRAMRTASPNP